LFFLRHGVEFLTLTTSTWKCTCRQSWILATHLLTVSSISDRHVQTRMLGPCTDDRIYYTVVRTGFRVCAASNAMRAWRDRIYKDRIIVHQCSRTSHWNGSGQFTENRTAQKVDPTLTGGKARYWTGHMQHTSVYSAYISVKSVLFIHSFIHSFSI